MFSSSNVSLYTNYTVSHINFFLTTRDSNAYLDTKHIYLNVKYKVMNATDKSGFTKDQYISCCNPAAQCLISSINMNIG